MDNLPLAIVQQETSLANTMAWDPILLGNSYLSCHPMTFFHDTSEEVYNKYND